MVVYSSRSFEYEKKKSAPKLRFLHRNECIIELMVSNLYYGTKYEALISVIYFSNSQGGW